MHMETILEALGAVRPVTACATSLIAAMAEEIGLAGIIDRFWCFRQVKSEMCCKIDPRRTGWCPGNPGGPRLGPPVLLHSPAVGPSCRSWSFHPSPVSIVLRLGLAASDAEAKAPTMHAACLSAYAGGDGSYRLGVSCTGLQAARCAAVGSG